MGAKLFTIQLPLVLCLPLVAVLLYCKKKGSNPLDGFAAIIYIYIKKGGYLVGSRVAYFLP